MSKAVKILATIIGIHFSTSTFCADEPPKPVNLATWTICDVLYASSHNEIRSGRAVGRAVSQEILEETLKRISGETPIFGEKCLNDRCSLINRTAMRFFILRKLVEFGYNVKTDVILETIQNLDSMSRFKNEKDEEEQKGQSDGWKPTGKPRLAIQHDLVNVVLTIKGTEFPDEIVEVNAHYDTVYDAVKGADDNGSGTVTALELARIFKKMPPPKRTIRIVFADLEERGFLGTREHVKLIAQSKEKVVGAIVVDMIGYFPKDKNEKPSFVIEVGNSYKHKSGESYEKTKKLANTIVDQMRAYDRYAQVEIALRDAMPYTADHGPYWSEGIPAVLIGARYNYPYINPGYHKPGTASEGGDTMANIHWDFLTSIVGQVAESTGRLAGIPVENIHDADLTPKADFLASTDNDRDYVDKKRKDENKPYEYKPYLYKPYKPSDYESKPIGSIEDKKFDGAYEPTKKKKKKNKKRDADNRIGGVITVTSSKQKNPDSNESEPLSFGWSFSTAFSRSEKYELYGEREEKLSLGHRLFDVLTKSIFGTNSNGDFVSKSGDLMLPKSAFGMRWGTSKIIENQNNFSFAQDAKGKSRLELLFSKSADLNDSAIKDSQHFKHYIYNTMEVIVGPRSGEGNSLSFIRIGNLVFSIKDYELQVSNYNPAHFSKGFFGLVFGTTVTEKRQMIYRLTSYLNFLKSFGGLENSSETLEFDPEAISATKALRSQDNPFGAKKVELEDDLPFRFVTEPADPKFVREQTYGYSLSRPSKGKLFLPGREALGVSFLQDILHEDTNSASLASDVMLLTRLSLDSYRAGEIAEDAGAIVRYGAGDLLIGRSP